LRTRAWTKGARLGRQCLRLPVSERGRRLPSTALRQPLACQSERNRVSGLEGA
jgi:hypothetical protein